MTDLPLEGRLENRCIIGVFGPEARAFLQGLLTNDLAKSQAGSAQYTAYLTPQGKISVDLIGLDLGQNAQGAQEFLLSVPRVRAQHFKQRLLMHRLRSKVEIADLSDDYIHILRVGHADLPDLNTGEADLQPALTRAHPDYAFVDPRPVTGVQHVFARRESGPWAGLPAIDAAWQSWRLNAGLPEPCSECEPETLFALEAGLEDLGGVDFHKGCFVGQETTSRMKRRTNVRRKLVRVRARAGTPGELPLAGTALSNPTGETIGELRSVSHSPTGELVGIALIRFDRLGPSGEAPWLVGTPPAGKPGMELRGGDDRIWQIDPPAWFLWPVPAPARPE